MGGEQIYVSTFNRIQMINVNIKWASSYKWKDAYSMLSCISLCELMTTILAVSKDNSEQ